MHEPIASRQFGNAKVDIVEHGLARPRMTPEEIHVLLNNLEHFPEAHNDFDCLDPFGELGTVYLFLRAGQLYARKGTRNPKDLSRELSRDNQIINIRLAVRPSPSTPQFTNSKREQEGQHYKDALDSPIFHHVSFTPGAMKEMYETGYADCKSEMKETILVLVSALEKVSTHFWKIRPTPLEPSAMMEQVDHAIQVAKSLQP